MKIELHRDVDAIGRVRFYLMQGTRCLDSTDDETKARELFEKAKTIKPISEVIASFDTDDLPEAKS